MAQLTYPFPAVGEVHNYEYLFKADSDGGKEDGNKARPVLVLAAGEGHVIVAAITTKGEVDGRRTLAVPPDVARAMGLPRPDESRILVDEANAFDWVGHDIRPISGKQTSCFGRATPRFTTMVIERFASFGGKPVKRT